MILFAGIILAHSADLDEFAVPNKESTMGHTRGVLQKVGDVLPPSILG